MNSKDTAREVAATILERNIEIAEAGAIDARYRDMLAAAEQLDEQASIRRQLLATLEKG